MSDYTRTPNLQLFKPTYDADDEMWGYHLNANADVLDAALTPGPGSAFLPLSGGAVDPNGLTVSNGADHAHGVVIKPIGMYDTLPTTSQAQLYSQLDLAQGRGGPNYNPNMAGQFITTVYGALDQSAVGVMGSVAFNGSGGVGQHCGVQAYANRYVNVAQPTTTVSATLSAPGNTISIADVSAFQIDQTPIVINGTGHLQVSHTGTSGPGTIAVADTISVADGTAGHVVQGNNNPQMWGLNINVNDNANNQNVTSSKLSSYSIGCELDLGVSGLDDAGPPLYGSPSGVRAMLTCIGFGGTSGNPAEIADAIMVGPAGGATISWKRFFRAAANATYSQAAIDLRGAVQGTGANALWLATGQSIAMDTAGQTKLIGNTNGQVVINGPQNDPLVLTTAAADYCRLYLSGARNWSMGVIATTGTFAIGDETAGAGRLTIDTSGNLAVPHGTATFTDPTTNSSGNADFTFAAPNNVYGVNILLAGNGTNPNKMIRVGGGNFDILDNSNTIVLFAMDNSGNATFRGGLFGFTNALISAANDAAAASAGVAVNGLYQNAGAVRIRLT